MLQVEQLRYVSLEGMSVFLTFLAVRLVLWAPKKSVILALEELEVQFKLAVAEAEASSSHYLTPSMIWMPNRYSRCKRAFHSIAPTISPFYQF